MRCEEFETRLNEALDRHLRPELDDELRAHANGCAECRETLAIYDALLTGFHALHAPQPSDDLAARVMAELRPQPRSAVRQVSIAGALLATAAALLIAVVGMFRPAAQEVALADAPLVAQAAPNNKTVPSNDTAAPQESPVEPVATPAVESLATAATSVETVAQDNNLSGEESLSKESARSLLDLRENKPYVELAKGTGRGLASLLLFVPGIGGTRGGIIDAKSNAVGEPAWAEQMSEGFKPVTDSVSQTFNIIWRALPVAETTRRS